jgi:hypothetical protein
MKRRVEYQFAEIRFERGQPADAAVVELLDRAGREGWRVGSLEMGPGEMAGPLGLKLLLERDLDH